MNSYGGVEMNVYGGDASCDDSSQEEHDKYMCIYEDCPRPTDFATQCVAPENASMWDYFSLNDENDNDHMEWCEFVWNLECSC